MATRIKPGDVFGRYTVKKYAQTLTGYAAWWCECSCGDVCRIISTGDLTSGRIKSCGCFRREFASKLCRHSQLPYYIDLKGRKYGRLTVIRYHGKSKDGENLWACRCLCGNEHIVRRGNLKKGSTKSCGCLTQVLRQRKMHKRRKSA